MKELLERLMELAWKGPAGWRLSVVTDSGDTEDVSADLELSDLLDEVQEFLDD